MSISYGVLAGGQMRDGQKVGACIGANPKDNLRWFPRYLEYMIFSNSSSALFYESILYIFRGKY
jgi:hypothetical protein